MAKRGNPKWVKGVSGNPAGKPINILKPIILDKTCNLEEVVDRVLKIMRESKSDGAVLQAAEWLRDTAGFKPTQMVEMPHGTDFVIMRANG